ncbi:hypothetical protein D3Z52_04040 [Clostridiaceae bacterium]|nr:hypothetical protein [Clostridiaceae bacterium]
MFCLPPPFPPVATRSVLDAGGLAALPRPPISRRARFTLRLRCFARRRRKGAAGAAGRMRRQWFTGFSLFLLFV